MAEQVDMIQFLNDPELIKEINKLMNPVINRTITEEENGNKEESRS